MATIERRGMKWRAKVRRKGMRPVSKTFDRRSDAEAWARQLEARVDLGDFIDGAAARGTTVRDGLERYAREVTPEKKGAKQEMVRIRWWLEQPIVDLPMSSVRASDITAVRDALVAEGKAPTTVSNKINIISALYRHAAAEWDMEGLRNPVQGIKRPRANRRRKRRPTDNELARIYAATDLETAYFVALAVETAARRGELAKLKRTEIDLPGRVMLLWDTKNGEDRHVPLSRVAAGILEDMLEQIPAERLRVFSWSADTYSHKFHDACVAAGIEDLTLHDMRHEGVSRLFEKGLSAMEVVSITGHKTMVEAKNYTHLQARNLADRLD